MLNLDELKKFYGIGLTGGIASGKSTVAEFLARKGFPVFDADILARDAVAPDGPVLPQIVDIFGKDVLRPDGSLDRDMLSRAIFDDQAKRQIVENLVHPEISRLLEKKLKSYGYLDNPRIWFFDAALLCETGNYRNFWQLWVVRCSLKNQLQRLKLTRGLSEERAEKIISAQMSTEEKIRLADFVINTDRPKKDVEAIIDAKLLELSA